MWKIGVTKISLSVSKTSKTSKPFFLISPMRNKGIVWWHKWHASSIPCRSLTGKSRGNALYWSLSSTDTKAAGSGPGRPLPNWSCEKRFTLDPWCLVLANWGQGESALSQDNMFFQMSLRQYLFSKKLACLKSLVQPRQHIQAWFSRCCKHQHPIWCWPC